MTELVHKETERAQKLPEPCRNSDRQDQTESIGRVESGYVRARFGWTPVLITPELAAQIRAFREKQS